MKSRQGPSKYLIIGNGGAAISAVRAIRSINLDDEIALISRESCPAYSPVLVTYYLRGSIGYEDMFICDEAFYQQNRVNQLLDRKAVKVDAGLKKVHVNSGEMFNYDNLLIATGSSPIIPAIEGANLPGVFTLYTADEAKRIITFIEGKESVAVIGAGPIGMQALGALIARGKKVLLVEMKDQVLPQILDPQGAGILAERLQQKEVDLHLGETVSSIRDNEGKMAVSLVSGIELKADAIILAVGVRPNIDFLQNSEIELGNGVIIDAHCRASKDGVYAAGDVAEAPDPITGYHRINATWPNAIEQGEVAGLNMAGQETATLHNLRFNTFTLFDFPCVSIGLIGGEGIELDEIVWQDKAVYQKLFFKDGLLVGAVLLGETDGAGIIANMIDRRRLFPDLYEKLRHQNVPWYSIKDNYWSKYLNTKVAYIGF